VAAAAGGLDPHSIESLDSLLEEMISGQQERLRALAARIAPHLTEEDLLQPHDHAAVRNHPDFQFEDGVLSGYLAVRAALRASR
jgi:hypothetical protein